MQYVYFTLAAVLLYMASDWILKLIERRRGARIEQRELVFFFILSLLAIIGFTLIRTLIPS